MINILFLLLVLVVPQMISVFLYERIRGVKLSNPKRVLLLIVFSLAIALFGYISFWVLREQAYHGWVLSGLSSAQGLLSRGLVLLTAAVLLPIAVHFYRKLLDIVLKDEPFDNNLLRQYWHCSLVLFTMLFIVYMLAPSIIALAAGEWLQYSVLFTVAAVIGGISLLLGGSVFLLSRNYKYIEGVLTGLLVLCFLNAFIFPFQAGLLDGREEFQGIRENPLPLIRNAIALLLLSGFFTLFRKQLRFLVIPVLLFSVVFTFSNTHRIYENQIENDLEIFDSASTFSTEQNVVVIVLDSLLGTLVERTFAENPQLYDGFEGFTMFTRAFTSYPFTSFSNIVIQSGRHFFSEDASWDENSIMSYSDSFLSDMKDVGFDVNIIGSKVGFPLQTEFPEIRRISVQRPWAVYDSLGSASMARIFGYWIQSPLYAQNLFHTEGWGASDFSAVVDGMLSDVEMTDELANQLSVTSEKNKLLYFWSNVTHTPTVLGRNGELNLNGYTFNNVTEQNHIDEIYFSMNQLVRLFETMKEKGVYNNSLIIIVSDHSTWFSPLSLEQHREFMLDFTDGIEREIGFRTTYKFNSVLMVKPPNAGGQAEISHDPAWNGDIRALINHYHDNFTYMPAVEVLAEIRAEKPEVGVVFVTESASNAEIIFSTRLHELIYVTSLFDIEAAFDARVR